MLSMHFLGLLQAWTPAAQAVPHAKTESVQGATNIYGIPWQCQHGTMETTHFYRLGKNIPRPHPQQIE